PTYPGFSPAIVDATGNPTAQYPEVQQINADVKAIGRYLLNAESSYVFENGTLPLGGSGPPVDSNVFVAGTANITVGVFTQPPFELALLASRDYSNSVSANVSFKALALQHFDRASGGWFDLNPSLAVLVQIAAGDAELYRYIAK